MDLKNQFLTHSNQYNVNKPQRQYKFNTYRLTNQLSLNNSFRIENYEQKTPKQIQQSKFKKSEFKQQIPREIEDLMKEFAKEKFFNEQKLQQKTDENNTFRNKIEELQIVNEQLSLENKELTVSNQFMTAQIKSRQNGQIESKVFQDLKQKCQELEEENQNLNNIIALGVSNNNQINQLNLEKGLVHKYQKQLLDSEIEYQKIMKENQRQQITIQKQQQELNEIPKNQQEMLSEIEQENLKLKSEITKLKIEFLKNQEYLTNLKNEKQLIMEQGKQLKMDFELELKKSEELCKKLKKDNQILKGKQFVLQNNQLQTRMDEQLKLDFEVKLQKQQELYNQLSEAFKILQQKQLVLEEKELQAQMLLTACQLKYEEQQSITKKCNQRDIENQKQIGYLEISGKKLEEIIEAKEHEINEFKAKIQQHKLIVEQIKQQELQLIQKQQQLEEINLIIVDIVGSNRELQKVNQQEIEIIGNRDNLKVNPQQNLNQINDLKEIFEQRYQQIISSDNKIKELKQSLITKEKELADLQILINIQKDNIKIQQIQIHQNQKQAEEQEQVNKLSEVQKVKAEQQSIELQENILKQQNQIKTLEDEISELKIQNQKLMLEKKQFLNTEVNLSKLNKEIRTLKHQNQENKQSLDYWEKEIQIKSKEVNLYRQDVQRIEKAKKKEIQSLNSVIAQLQRSIFIEKEQFKKTQTTYKKQEEKYQQTIAGLEFKIQSKQVEDQQIENCSSIQLVPKINAINTQEQKQQQSQQDQVVQHTRTKSAYVFNNQTEGKAFQQQQEQKQFSRHQITQALQKQEKIISNQHKVIEKQTKVIKKLEKWIQKLKSKIHNQKSQTNQNQINCQTDQVTQANKALEKGQGQFKNEVKENLISQIDVWKKRYLSLQQHKNNEFEDLKVQNMMLQKEIEQINSLNQELLENAQLFKAQEDKCIEFYKTKLDQNSVSILLLSFEIERLHHILDLMGRQEEQKRLEQRNNQKMQALNSRKSSNKNSLTDIQNNPTKILPSKYNRSTYHSPMKSKMDTFDDLENSILEIQQQYL